jgi:uncharacterized protein YcbK (DUF882 family)
MNQNMIHCIVIRLFRECKTSKSRDKFGDHLSRWRHPDSNEGGVSGMISGLPAIILLGLLLSVPTMAGAAASPPSRFFIIGDGWIHIRNAKTGQEAKVTLFTTDGSLNEEGFNRIDKVFGFPTGEKGEHISPRLICMLDHFSDLVAPGKVINLDSGYRSPEYNGTIRNAGGNVARTSQHIDGMAIDFNIDGVDGKSLWTIIKNEECCGVGYYGGTDIHLDSARPRFWEAATSKIRTGESDYNQRIYLSTDYDRYRSGEKVRLSLSAISDFSFGINRTVTLTSDTSGTGTTVQVTTGNAADCVMITNRKASRFIYIDLPVRLPAGKYRVKMDFCNRPFPQMPVEILSNEIELSDRPVEKNSPPSPLPKSLH